VVQQRLSTKGGDQSKSIIVVSDTPYLQSLASNVIKEHIDSLGSSLLESGVQVGLVIVEAVIESKLLQ